MGPVRASPISLAACFCVAIDRNTIRDEPWLVYEPRQSQDHRERSIVSHLQSSRTLTARSLLIWYRYIAFSPRRRLPARSAASPNWSASEDEDGCSSLAAVEL